jgi:hypothetical protein
LKKIKISGREEEIDLKGNEERKRSQKMRRWQTMAMATNHWKNQKIRGLKKLSIIKNKNFSRKIIGRIVRGDYSFIKASGNALGLFVVNENRVNNNSP